MCTTFDLRRSVHYGLYRLTLLATRAFAVSFCRLNLTTYKQYRFFGKSYLLVSLRATYLRFQTKITKYSILTAAITLILVGILCYLRKGGRQSSNLQTCLLNILTIFLVNIVNLAVIFAIIIFKIRFYLKFITVW